MKWHVTTWVNLKINTLSEKYEYAYFITVYINFGKTKIIHSGRNKITGCQWGSGGVWKGEKKGLQRGRRNLLAMWMCHLDCGDSFKEMHICQNIKLYTLYVQFYVN